MTTSHKDAPASPSLPAPPTSLTRFTKLPAELRRMIYRMALPGPRHMKLILRLVQGPDNSTASRENQKDSSQKEPHKPCGYDCFSPTPNPTMLYVCNEARREALRIYSTAFTWECKVTKFESIPQTYIDFEKDIVHFEPQRNYNENSYTALLRMLTCISTSDTKKIKNLAIRWNAIAYCGLELADATTNLLEKFPNIKNFKATGCLDEFDCYNGKNQVLYLMKNGERANQYMEE